MPLQAQFVSGEPVFEDYTPVGALAAGDVVVTSLTPRIVHRAIAAGELGALAGAGGIYRVKSLDATMAANVKVYWVDASDGVTVTAGSNKVFGVTVTTASASDGYVEVFHDPAY